MARDHAQVRVTIWADDDFRQLSPAAQHLYFALFTSPGLSYCGVSDWRPNRIAPFAAGWTVPDVIRAGDELQDRLYVLFDHDTEEALVRSFVRNDGLMKQPNMATAMANDHAIISSASLRGVVVHELQRLKEGFPDLKGWASGKAGLVLTMPSVDPSVHPWVKGSVDPSVTAPVEGESKGSVEGCPTPLLPSSLLLTPPPSSKLITAKAKRPTQIPADFPLDANLREWATNGGVVNVEHETEQWWDYHKAKGDTAADWTASWRTWMRNSVKFSTQNRTQTNGTASDKAAAWLGMDIGPNQIAIGGTS